MANIVLDFLHNYQTGERRETEPANAYQYDEGHVLEAVLPEVITACEIHYWIRGMEEADAYTPTSITPNDDSSCTVLGNIPNKYFETNGELRIYIVVTDGTASITTYEGKLHICQRSMPEDYVDDDPENEAVRVITEARAAAATATEKAGEAAESAEQAQEILDSIPADYTRMSEDVDTLKADTSTLNEDLNKTIDDGYYEDLRALTTTAENWKVVPSTGLCTGDSNYQIIKYEVVAGELLKIVSDYNFQFQTVASVPSNGSSNRVGVTYEVGTYYLVVPASATYLIVTSPKSGSTSAVYSVKPIATEASLNVYKNTNDIKALHSWSNGRLSNQGTIAATLTRIVSGIRYADTDLLVSLSDYTTYQWANAIYTDNAFTSPSFSWWLSEPQIIKKGCWYCISASLKTGETVIADIPNSNVYKALSIVPIYADSILPIAEETMAIANGLKGVLKRTKNLWDSSKDLHGWRVNGDRLTQNSAWFTSDFIPVTPSTTYTVSMDGVSAAGIRPTAWGSDFASLGDITPTAGTFTTPANCYYVRLGSLVNGNNKQMEIGSAVTDYVPYYIIDESSIAVSYPSYYESALATSIASIKTALGDAGINKSAFCFLTDVHWGRNQKHSPALIREIVNHTPISNVICGGDVVTDLDTKINSLAELYDFQNAFKYLGDRFYNCIGNHDNNNNGGGQPAEQLTDNELYATLYAQSESPYIVWGDYYTYYFDNSAEKTRYLFTDTGWFRMWNKPRINFMAEALNSLEDGWHCVLITHVIYASYSDSEPPAFVKVLLDMLDNYNARQAHTIGYSDYGQSVTEDGEIPYDFTNAKGTCKLVVGGHTHVDQTYTTSGGIVCIMFDCDAQSTMSGNPSTSGTVNEQCITTVIADYNSNVCKCIRLGRGQDATYNLLT